MQFINFLINIDTIIYVYTGLLFFLIAGIIIKDKSRNIKEYALGIKPFPKHFLVATMSATLIGGGSTIGEVSLYYNKGLLYMFPAVLGYFGYIIFARYILPRLDQYYGELSVASLLSRMYGKSVERFSGIIAYIYCFSVLAMQVKAIGIIIEYALGYNSIFATVVSFLVITIYSALGGVRSVIRTDVIQFLIFIVVLPTIAVFLLKENGGIYAVFKETSWQLTENFNLVSYISLFAFVFIPDISPIFIHRVLVGRERKKNKEIIYLTVLMQLICSFFVIVVSAIAIGRYQEMSGNLVFFKTIDEVVQNNLFHSLFAIAILAVILSSADSLMNTGAIIFVENIIKDRINNNSVRLVVIKVATALGGLLGLFIALNTKNLIEAIWFIAQYYAAIIVVPFIGGLFVKNASSYIFWGCSISGFASYTLLRILAPEIEHTAYVISIVVSLTTFMCIKYFIDKNTKNHKQFSTKLENTTGNIIRQMNMPISKLGYAILPIPFLTMILLISTNEISINTMLLNIFAGFIGVSFICIDTVFQNKRRVIHHCYILFSILYCFPFLSTYLYYSLSNSNVAFANMIISCTFLAVIFSSKLLVIFMTAGVILGTIVFTILQPIILYEFLLHGIILTSIVIYIGIISYFILRTKEADIKKFIDDLIKKTESEDSKKSLQLVDQYANVIEIVKKHEKAKEVFLKKRAGFNGYVEFNDIVKVDIDELVKNLRDYLSLIELEKDIKFDIHNAIKNVILVQPLSMVYTIIFSIVYYMVGFNKDLIKVHINCRNKQLNVKCSIANLKLNIMEIKKYIKHMNRPEGIMSYEVVEKIIKEQDGMKIKMEQNSILFRISTIYGEMQKESIKFIDICAADNTKTKILN